MNYALGKGVACNILGGEEYFHREAEGIFCAVRGFMCGGKKAFRLILA